MDKHSSSNQNVVRYFSLFILTLQTTMTVLVMRYSRKKNEGAKDLYIATTLVLVSELIKFGFCVLLLILQKSGSFVQTYKTMLSEIVLKPWETAKLAIPSSLYTIQNNLILLALSSLDAATFQVSYQLKILTTAFFSVILLRKEIKPLQWLALCILMSGVVLVQFPSGASKPDAVSHYNQQQRLLGLLAVVISSLSSGFAGVYYEKLLKESAQPSVIIRNIQLGIFSIIFGAAGVFFNDWDAVRERGFFDGYSPVVWVVVMLQAVGGLVVAAVIKYADNILKGFATSVSIVLSCLFSFVVFHDLTLELNFVLGTGLVIGATFLYGRQSYQPSISTNEVNTNNPPIDGDSEGDSDKEETGHTYKKAGSDRGYVKLSV